MYLRLMFRVKHILTFLIGILISLTINAKVIEVIYYPNGNVKVEKIKLKKGIVQVNQYYPSGELFETGFTKNGLFQGQWTRYAESGEILATAFYHNHVKIGSWNHYNRWDESTFKVSYQNGEAVSYRKYNENGQLIASGNRISQE